MKPIIQENDNGQDTDLFGCVLFTQATPPQLCNAG